MVELQQTLEDMSRAGWAGIAKSWLKMSRSEVNGGWSFDEVFICPV
jgi:hypothetical protein